MNDVKHVHCASRSLPADAVHVFKYDVHSALSAGSHTGTEAAKHALRNAKKIIVLPFLLTAFADRRAAAPDPTRL